MFPESLGLLPVNSAAGFPGNYNLVLQNNSFPVMIENFGAGRCAALSGAPFNFGQAFWYSN